MGWSLSFANLRLCQSVNCEYVGKERGREDVLCTANDVTPLYTHFIPSFDVDDFARRGRIGVTRYIPVVDVQDRVVGRSDTDTISLAIIYAVDADALGDGVGRG
jgi:hypothetical protein